jgi:hypothetical protein
MLAMDTAIISGAKYTRLASGVSGRQKRREAVRAHL